MFVNTKIFLYKYIADKSIHFDLTPLSFKPQLIPIIVFDLKIRYSLNKKQNQSIELFRYYLIN